MLSARTFQEEDTVFKHEYDTPGVHTSLLPESGGGNFAQLH